MSLLQRISIDIQQILLLPRKKLHHILVRENPSHCIPPPTPNTNPVNYIFYGFKIYCIKFVCLLVFGATAPQWPRASWFTKFLDHTQTHHIRWDSSGRVISPSQKHLPDITQHSQQTDIHAPGEIRTHNPRKRTAADRRLRPRGHWDRHCIK